MNGPEGMVIVWGKFLRHSARKANYGADSVALVEQLKSTFIDLLDPALVSPVVAFLAHQECPVTGEIYTVGGGNISRFFIGRTRGYFNAALSVEDVRDHLAQIRDETGYTVPATPARRSSTCSRQ